ncbi:MAG: hypothetical protein LBG05_04960 [Treponema sp.]|jgi:hypothetical protein|nr:hypothetical protein [Treponema sp.]
MSVFKKEITLTNAGAARNGLIPETKIRKVIAEAMPDGGALRLVIAETSESAMAYGKTDTCNITEGVKIQWKNRSAALPAIVVSNAKDMFLGALSLEAMDVMVDPVHERLVGLHGGKPLRALYAVTRIPRLASRA